MLEIKYRLTSELIGYVNNSRTHSDDQVAQISASIKEFGFTNPLLLDESSGIIAGHGRLLAAKKLSMDEVPTITLVGLTDIQRKAYVIADNKLALNAGWDDELLALELKSLQGDDFDLSLIGFDVDELALLLEPEQVDGLTDEDDVPELPETPVSVLGDIWLLGNHRLMCGDSTSIDAVEKLMDGQKADMVFTDPPYGAGFNIKNDKPDEFKVIFDLAMTNASTICDNVFLIACYYSCIAEFVIKMRELGFKFNEKIVWVKNLFGQGKVFHRKHEDILFFSKDNHVKDYRNKHDDAIQFDSVRNFMGSKNAKEACGHPTQKPVELIQYVMRPFLSDTWNVYDCFLGSGSTLIACENVKKKCYGMELDEKYVDVIIKRWEEYTGKQSTHAETGKTFSEMSNG